MKTKNLLPYSWRPYGWVLLFSSALLGMWTLFSGFDLTEYLVVKIPEHLISWIPWFRSENILISNEAGYIYLALTDEALCLGIIAGAIIVGFSRQKVEDEWIAQMRLEALQWGIYANYAVLALCIILVHGGGFFSVMIYNMFTPLLIFVARFYWLLTVGSALEARKESKKAQL